MLFANKQIFVVDDESVCRLSSMLLTVYWIISDTFTSVEAFFRAVSSRVSGWIKEVFLTHKAVIPPGIIFAFRR
jgi:hypothetical protein